MSTRNQIESRLAATLAARADIVVRPDAIDRLRNVDYRPRGRRMRVPVTLGVLAGTAGAATAAAAVLVVGSATPAYAGWSPVPTDSATSPAPSAAASCQNQLSTMPGPGGSSSTASSSGSGSWESVLTDVRGPFTVALYQNGDEYAACFSSSSFTVINEVESSGSSGRSSVSMGASASGSGSPSEATSGTSVSSTATGDLNQVLQNHLTTSNDGPYTLVDGRTKSGVSAVGLVEDGQDVVATVADGWFVAWWPGSDSATTAQVTTATGTTTEALTAAAPAPPPPGTCPTGTSGQSAKNASSGTGAGTNCSGAASGSGGAATTGGPVTHSATGGPST